MFNIYLWDTLQTFAIYKEQNQGFHVVYLKKQNLYWIKTKEKEQQCCNESEKAVGGSVPLKLRGLKR